MIETNLLKNLLLISNPKVLGLSEYLSQTALLFILPAFYIGVIVEYFTNFDFKSVAKRALIAFFAIKLFLPIHVEAVDMSLSTSSKLLSQYSSQNKFLTAYQNASTASDSKNGIWTRLKSIVTIIINDPVVIFIFLLSYSSFFLLTQLYSLIYYLAIALFGFCAVLSIFPITSKSLTGAVYTSLWCVLMPFVVMIVLALIGDSDVFLKDYYAGGIVQNLESLIQLLVMTILLLLTPMLTTKIMNGTGINAVADNIGQMAGMTAMIGGAKVAATSLGGTGRMLGGGLHNVTTKPLMNTVKDYLSNRAGEIAKQKEIGPSLNTLTNDSFKERVKGGVGDFKEAFQKTDFKEKAIIGADSLFNRKENQLAKVARSKDATDLKDYHATKKGDHRFQYRKADDSKLKLPLSGYKEEARNFQEKTQAQRNLSRSVPDSQSFLRDRQNQDIKQPPRQSFRDTYSRSKQAVNPLGFSQERLGIVPARKTKLNLYQFKKWEDRDGWNSAIQRRH